jgi:hypothetical protein
MRGLIVIIPHIHTVCLEHSFSKDLEVLWQRKSDQILQCKNSTTIIELGIIWYISFARITTTKYHRLIDINNRNLSSHSSGS